MLGQRGYWIGYTNGFCGYGETHAIVNLLEINRFIVHRKGQEWQLTGQLKTSAGQTHVIRADFVPIRSYRDEEAAMAALRNVKDFMHGCITFDFLKRKLGECVEKVDKTVTEEMILAALQKNKGNARKTVTELPCGKTRFYELIKEFGIKPNDFRQRARRRPNARP